MFDNGSLNLLVWTQTCNQTIILVESLNLLPYIPAYNAMIFLVHIIMPKTGPHIIYRFLAFINKSRAQRALNFTPSVNKY